jgi:tetratricopeptide (TPR) repeat protein
MRLLLWIALVAFISLTSLEIVEIHARLNIGHVYLNQAHVGNANKGQLAQNSFRQITKHNNYNDRVGWALGQAVFLNEADAAIDIWRNNSLAVLRLNDYAQFVANQQDWSMAQVYYHVLCQIDPQNSDHWYNHGRTAQRLQEWEIALESYDQAINLNAFTIFQPSDAYYQRGVVYQFGGPEITDLRAAIQNYEYALQLNQFTTPEIEAESWYKIGEIYSWQGESADTLANIFSKTLTINPRHNWARLRYG